MRRRWLVGLIAIAAFIGGALASGIVGNLGTDVFRWLLSQVAMSIKADLWPWAIALVCLVGVFCFFVYSRILNRALTTSNNLLELDDSLLRLLASWIPARDHVEEMKLLLAELLRDACREFGHHVHRASILLPNTSAEGKHLKIWASCGMPQETVAQVKFYVGDDGSKQVSQGVAGEVFLSRRLCVGHMTLVKGIWRCDCPSFIRFTQMNDPPAYSSFVCMPIIGPSADRSGRDSITCLGVVCFDSSNQAVFDTFEARTVLRVFARRIAATLLMYRLLPSSPN